jgi:hypothetical protein
MLVCWGLAASWFCSIWLASLSRLQVEGFCDFV